MKSEYAQVRQYTIHSQSKYFPKCGFDMAELTRLNGGRRPDIQPDSSQDLWTGFSALYMDTSSGSGWGQPLSSSGSCLPKFEIQPVVECSTHPGCEVIFDESSMWMSTAPEIGSGSTVGEHLPEGEIEYDAGNPTPVTDYISRCSVCESTYPWLAVHSFNDRVPDCPQASDGKFVAYKIWVGWSLIMAKDRGGGVGQDLTTPGSCLKRFSPLMSAKCQYSGTQVSGPNCVFQSANAEILFVRNSEKEVAESVFSLDPDLPTYFSRCSVCIMKMLR